MGTNSIDILRAATGEEGGPELVQAIHRMTLAELNSLTVSLLENPPSPRKSAPHNEIWPLVNARASFLSMGSGTIADVSNPAGLNLSSAMDPRQVGRNLFSDGVVRALLYSHGLVIEDPVVMAADLFFDQPANVKPIVRRFIEASVTSMVEIEHLLDSGVVETFFVSEVERADDSPLMNHFVDKFAENLGEGELFDHFEASFVDGLSDPLRKLWTEIRAGNRNPPIELVEDAIADGDPHLVETFIEVVAELNPTGIFKNAAATLASALSDLDRFGNSHDLFCPSPLFERLLLAGRPDPVAEMRVHQLAHTPVPNITALGMRDVVAIRRSSDALETWRAQLSLGLDHAFRLRSELGPDVDISAAIAEFFVAARSELVRETKHSRVINASGWTTFVASSLGGLISGAVSGPEGAIAGVAGGLVAGAAQGALSKPNEKDRLLARHYIVFDQSPEVQLDV